ncbi:hypothetical protein LWI28_018670 [Acer negundo]|uniref:Pectinesterase n=1 Tax=Acer negundo TaxID=4023 RepID=A0AAD5P5H8_ACENE|nr:hypothetical protein LWI28_018670 [Acer negundo]
MSILNSAGPEGRQAVTLRTSGNHIACLRCSIEGFQDTLYVHKGKSQFFYDCDIYGTIDFIFGDAAVIIQNSTIHVVSCSETIKSSVVEASLVKFVPSIRSGSYANIGTRDSMDDEHIQIDDLSAHLGSLFKCPTPSAFYAVFDGHGGPEAAAYIKKNAMKLFFEDAELPETSAIDDAFLQELENSHRRAFLLADLALADEHSVSCTCGTTAL